MIISLEGIDNSGKTTQADLLANRFCSEGFTVIVSKELSTDIGVLLKKSFKNLHYSSVMKTLLFSADRQERLEKLKEHLEIQSNIVIFDRYIHSALAYRYSEGVDEQWVLNVNKYVPQIDLGFYIDITSEESISRNTTDKDNIFYSQYQLEIIRKRYLTYVERGELALIDGSMNKNDITSEILNVILQCNQKKKL